MIYTSDDGSFGLHGLVTQPLETMLKQANTLGPGIGEVIAIGPPLMMRAVSELTRPYGVKTIASLNSVMIDATGMCGACMVPIQKKTNSSENTPVWMARSLMPIASIGRNSSHDLNSSISRN